MRPRSVVVLVLPPSTIGSADSEAEGHSASAVPTTPTRSHLSMHEGFDAVAEGENAKAVAHEQNRIIAVIFIATRWRRPTQGLKKKKNNDEVSGVEGDRRVWYRREE